MNFDKAVIDLLLDRPFFGTILSSLYITEGDVETACTNGRVIRINPKFWESLSNSQSISLLAHEALHVGLCHHVRIGMRDPVLWNIAADMAINPLLVESGFELPPGALCDFADPPRSAEEIYSELAKNPPRPPGPWGNVEPLDHTASINEEEERIGQLITRAGAIAGSLPLGLERICKKILEPPSIPWDIVLVDFVKQVSSEEYSTRHFSSRHLQRGLYLPSLKSPQLNIVIVLDTSGSISEGNLALFCSAIENIRLAYTSYITLLYCDAQVYEPDIIRPEDPLLVKCRGGGGTNFRPPFEWIEAHPEIEADCVIYFTDGECGSYPDSLPIPTSWIIVQEEKLTVKIGQFWKGES